MGDISGFININKPTGMSSAAAVSKVKRATGMPCGHMGTLDPMASGVLPVAVGNASRLFNYLIDKEKIYRAEFTFGAETDTLDGTGTVLRGGLRVPSEGEIVSVLGEFVGNIEQVPPQYSAKSVNGVRAYQLARRGEYMELQSKTVRVVAFELVQRKAPNAFEFLIRCGGGTYIRALARDLASRLDTAAYMSALVREKSGFFTLENSIDLQELGNWRQYLIAPDSVFELPALDFDGGDARKLRNGLGLPFDGKDGEYKLYLDDDFYGIAQAKDGNIRAKVKLCANSAF